MSLTNGDSAVKSTSEPSVGTLIKHFDSETSCTSCNGYTVKDRSVTIEHTEIDISSTQRVNVDPSRWHWDTPNSHSVHITSNPTKFRNDTCEASLPDVGIMRINYPDSVAKHHPRKVADDGVVITEGGVTVDVLSSVLTAISKDGTKNNQLKSMQWTLNAPVKLIPSTPSKYARQLEASTDSSQSGNDSCYSTTLPPDIPYQCSLSEDDDPMGHHVAHSFETVLVELWYTLTNDNDAFKSNKAQLQYIQQRVTTHVIDKLLCNNRTDYRVFVVTTEMKSF